MANNQDAGTIATAQTYAELLVEIDSFVPVVTPCEGSEYPWIHRPGRIIDGITRVPGIRCGCGRVFEAHAYEAPSNQPSPELWAAFQKFKAHSEELATAKRIEQARILDYELRTGERE